MSKIRRTPSDVVKSSLGGYVSWYSLLKCEDKKWVDDIIAEVAKAPETSHYSVADIVIDELQLTITRERIARIIKVKAVQWLKENPQKK